MASMTEYQKSLEAWKKAYPYIVNKSTGIKLGDYEDARRKFLVAWGKANPYNGPTSNFGFTAQDWISGGTPTFSDYDAYNQHSAYEGQMEEAFSKMLTPEQSAEFSALKKANDDKNRKRGRIAAAAMFAGIGGLGALGAGALGGGALGGGAAGGASSLGGSGLMGAEWLGGLGQFGGLGGAEALGGAAYGASGLGTGLGASLGGAGALGASGLGSLGEGALMGNEWLGGLGQFGGLGGADAVGGAVVDAAGLGGAGGSLGGAGGSSWLTQLQNILKGGGSLSDALKGIGGSGSGGVNWLNLLGNLGGGLIQSNASGNAANAQLQAGREANALLREMWQQGREDQKPYREAGTSALAGIQALLKDPSSIAGMPDYQFGFDQGNKALANSAAARGMTYSGQQGKALQRYGQDYAGSKLSESYNRLANLAGLGQVSTNQTGNLGANYANNLANNIEAQGNVQGSAYMGKGSAWTNAIGGALNGLSEQDFINALLKGG